MAVLFLVESFVKDNVSSIIGLISTIVIMIIGYKLNIIIQKSNSKSHTRNSRIIQGKIIETSPYNSNANNNKNNGTKVESIKSEIENRDRNNNNKHHRRNNRICSCECMTYNKISANRINNSYALKKECLSDIHMLLTSELLDLLINHFILLHSNNECISQDIVSLIYLYYNNYLYTQIFVIKGSHKGRNSSLNKIECINLNYKIKYNIDVYNINDIDIDNNEIEFEDCDEIPLSTSYRNWDTEENGICFVPNINISQLIPKYILNKINNIYNKYADNNYLYFNNNNNNKLHGYNAIFKCAGMTALGSNLSLNNNASMIIFKENSFKKYNNNNNNNEFDNECNENIVGFEINLPALPRSQTYCAQTVYSSKYGLITNCRDNAFVLDIKQWKDNNEIHWKKLPSMLNRRNWASSLCVIDDDICGGDYDKLFICSGDGVCKKSCEIFSFIDNKWYNKCEMNDSFLMQSGIYYDNIGNNKIYIGGGYKTEQKITYYSLYKNKWYDLPDTKYKHSEYPSIWCNKFQINNILYINGNTRNDLSVIEYIDLRTNQWNLCSNNMQINQYIETPQLFKHHNGEKLSNHHRNNSNHYPMQIRRTFV